MQCDLQSAVLMNNPYTGGIGLDARGVAVDADHDLVVQSQNDGRLSGPYSQKLNFPPRRCFYDNFPFLTPIDSFSE